MQQGCVKSLFQRLGEVKSLVQGHCKQKGQEGNHHVVGQATNWVPHRELLFWGQRKSPGTDNYHEEDEN